MRNSCDSDAIKYIRSLFAIEDDILKKADQIAKNNNIPIHIGAEEGKFIQILLQLMNAQKIVEVGTLAGYSTTWLARSISESGKVYSFESQEQHINFAKQTFEHSNIQDKIELILGDAVEKLETINHKGPFDVIFIDADKISYTKYLDWAEKNIRTGGLIIGDNTFLFGAMYKKQLPEGVRKQAKQVMGEFNTRLADRAKYSSVIVPTKEGMTIAIKLF